jgi:hypothetical protein
MIIMESQTEPPSCYASRRVKAGGNDDDFRESDRATVLL